MEFTDVQPDQDCPCGACTPARRARRHRPPSRTRLLVAAVGAGLGGTAVAPAVVAAAVTPQHQVNPVTSTEIMERAQRWVDQRVPYSMSRHWSDGYRQDCSGFVSMAWGLPHSETTWTLPKYAARIAKSDLQPGDALIFNDSSGFGGGSHVALFGGWLDDAHTRYLAYEQTPPHAIERATPYPYWHHSGGYVPYRFKGLTSPPGNSFPGRDNFGPGHRNEYVTRLGEQLVRKGYGRYYREGPDPEWGEADRRNVRDFQQAQGWTGTDADGYPGPETWRRLFS